MRKTLKWLRLAPAIALLATGAACSAANGVHGPSGNSHPGQVEMTTIHKVPGLQGLTAKRLTVNSSFTTSSGARSDSFDVVSVDGASMPELSHAQSFAQAAVNFYGSFQGKYLKEIFESPAPPYPVYFKVGFAKATAHTILVTQSRALFTQVSKHDPVLHGGAGYSITWRSESATRTVTILLVQNSSTEHGQFMNARGIGTGECQATVDVEVPPATVSAWGFKGPKRQDAIDLLRRYGQEVACNSIGDAAANAVVYRMNYATYVLWAVGSFYGDLPLHPLPLQLGQSYYAQFN